MPVSGLILDTNILQYVSNKSSRDAISGHLSDLESEGVTFSISEITIYELLCGTNSTQRVNGRAILQQFTRYGINQDILSFCSYLQTWYRQNLTHYQSISTADIIIAATAMFISSGILTADCNDFPRPFFSEERILTMEYRHKNKMRMIPLYVLLPNEEVISTYYRQSITES